MAEKKVIIHPDCIKNELRRKNVSSERRVDLENALSLIKSTLRNAKNLVITDNIPLKRGTFALDRKYLEGDIYLLREDDPVFLKDCVQSGDEVEVYGAYRDYCIKFAVDCIKSTGATVKISEKGTIF